MAAYRRDNLKSHVRADCLRTGISYITINKYGRTVWKSDMRADCRHIDVSASSEIPVSVHRNQLWAERSVTVRENFTFLTSNVDVNNHVIFTVVKYEWY